MFHPTHAYAKIRAKIPQIHIERASARERTQITHAHRQRMYGYKDDRPTGGKGQRENTQKQKTIARTAPAQTEKGENREQKIERKDHFAALTVSSHLL